MYNLNNLIGLPVLSLYEGELNGKVENIFFDKKLKRVLLFSVRGEDDIKYILPVKNIYKIGKNAITIKNNTCLQLELNDFNAIPSPFEAKTYTIHGEYIGKIDQITFNEKFLVDTILLDNGKTLECENLLSCSKNTILTYDKNTKVNISKFKNRQMPKIFKSTSTHEVKILPEPHPTIEELPQEINLPQTISNRPDFLIGRVVTKDIYIDDNNLLIKADSTITERVLALAYTNNILKELMLYSKQK